MPHTDYDLVSMYQMIMDLVEKENQLATNVEIVRLECTTGSSNKFWEMTATNSSRTISVRYGKIGSQGRTQTSTYTSAWKYNSEKNKRVNSKLAKGYKRVKAESKKPATKTGSKAGEPTGEDLIYFLDI